MTLSEFAWLVAEMRAAQNLYFKDRRTSDLEKSKRLERRVDDAIRSIGKPPEPQLFDQGGES